MGLHAVRGENRWQRICGEGSTLQVHLVEDILSIYTRRHTIELTVKDLVANFLYYDRKEDEELRVGQIQEAIRAGEISIDEITNLFKYEISKGLD